MTSSLLRLAAILTSLLASGAALAQSAACQHYRSQLAALERGGRSSQYAAMAERQRGELARMQGYYQSLGCERSQFSFFGLAPNPQCGAAAQQVRAMEANYARLASQSGGGGDFDDRRRQLRAAIEQNCQPRREAALGAPSRGGVFERLFNTPERRRNDDDDDRKRRVRDDDDEPRRYGGGAGRPVCVRACDGYFFPLSNVPGGRQGGDDLCQALCPGAEAALYYLPSDSDLDRAVSAKGKPYAHLPAAYRFQKSHDPSCSCRKQGQTWAEALRKAEAMLDRKSGDIIVTSQKAEELSRPKFSKRDIRKALEEKAKEKLRDGVGADDSATQATVDAAESKAAAETGAAAPTASRESAGIGPKTIEKERIVGRDDGAKNEVVTADGLRRTVRIVAPNVIPVPQTRM